MTFTVFVLKTVVTALKKYPHFNASLDTAAGEIVLKKYYHLGVAVNTEDGLIVPVIRDVDRKSIEELSIELNDLVQRTGARKAKLEEMQETLDLLDYKIGVYEDAVLKRENEMALVED